MQPNTCPSCRVRIEDMYVRVGVLVQEFREMRGLGRDQCASSAQMSRSHLANIEAGRRPLTRVAAARLAKVLNVRQAALIPPGYFADEAADSEQVPA